VGALGVGIGFGLQNVVNNFVSGLILLYERPVQKSDIIEVGSLLGEVRRIGVRSSTVRTYDGAEVIVPNASLISQEVVNWTLSDRTRRIEIPLNVAYGTDPGRVIDLLLAAVTDKRGVLQMPQPVALFQGFGDSSLDFVVRFWTAEFDRWSQVSSDVRAAIYDAVRKDGIEIPFPQRDLHVRAGTLEARPPA
jgi:small-conductance mechanosensitive channel